MTFHRRILYRYANVSKSMFFKCAKPGLLFIIVFFSAQLQIYHKIWLHVKWISLDCTLGIWTRDSRMVGADESTKLWWTLLNRCSKMVKRTANLTFQCGKRPKRKIFKSDLLENWILRGVRRYLAEAEAWKWNKFCRTWRSRDRPSGYDESEAGSVAGGHAALAAR